MSDIIDQANDAADLFQRADLDAHRRHARRTIPKGIGICLNCGCDVKGDGRWCGPDCRDAWEEDRRS